MNFVSKFLILFKRKFILSHEPLFIMKKCKDIIFIYGHVHNSKYFKNKTWNSYRVSCERTKYYPITIQEVEDCIEKPLMNLDYNGLLTKPTIDYRQL